MITDGALGASDFETGSELDTLVKGKTIKASLLCLQQTCWFWHLVALGQAPSWTPWSRARPSRWVWAGKKTETV